MKRIMKTVYLLVMIAVLICPGCGDDDDSTDSHGADNTQNDDSSSGANDDVVNDDNDADDDADDDSDDDADDDSDDDIDDDADDDVDDDADDDVDDDAFPSCADYGFAMADGNIPGDILNETSGLAASLQNPGVLWGHNDSGDGPKVYAMTLTGDYLGTATLTGAQAVDWEDMTLGPCGLRSGECLYMGDHGDNGASRTDCAIYRLPEPYVDPLTPFGEMNLDDWERFPFSYPDEPRDAEALAIHPDGSLYVFSKYPAGVSEMFAFPPLTEPEQPVTVTWIADLDTGNIEGQWTTAADIHRNGNRLILRTYITVWEWRLATGESFLNIASAERVSAPFGLEGQGESIAYDPAAGEYLHTSERLTDQDPPIYRIPCSGR